MPNTPDIDLSALAEALNEKMDRDLGNKTANIRYVVDEWHSGTEWYRVWSDGWIEQGGNTSGTGGKTVNLHKPFSDTNYSVFVSTYNVAGAGYNSIGVQATKTTTTFGTYNVYAIGMWFACGY